MPISNLDDDLSNWFSELRDIEAHPEDECFVYPLKPRQVVEEKQLEVA